MCPSTRSWIARTLPPHSRSASVALANAFLGLAAASAAAEPCRLARAAELPVTMEDMRPLVHAAINGRDALFVADSGAFFSMLTPAAAREFNLPLEPAPPGFGLVGVGGGAQVWHTTVQKFTIFDMDVTRVPFLVAGNDLGHGAIGLLGQNVFRLGDVEYDLANGVISILRTHGDCRKASLAYWANARDLPYSVIDIDFASPERPHTTGVAYVNGSKIRVLFDTGANTSVLTLDAAKRAGITPEAPGVTAGGTSSGIGRHTVRTWIAPFASFKIGDEEIRNTHLRIGDVELPRTDMLIGADFFLSHHVLVASSQRKLYFTYNGGPVFNLTTMRALPPAAAEPAPASGTEPGPAAAAASQPAQPEPLDAAGYARRGSASASRRDYEHALADLTKAIALDPTQADYFYERGRAYGSNNQTDKAFEDFSQAIKLEPGDVPARLARAELRVRRNDPADAISPDLDAADRAAPKEGDMRLALGNLYQRIGNYPAAIAQYDHWIDSHNRDDIQMPRARHARCSARALTGRSLEQALDDCNFALRKDPKVAAFFDSRGLVYLRQGKYDKAIADYDAALALDPKLAWALYGRGLARQHLGQSAAGQADVAAATALAPKIADEAARNGVVP
ncbi:MAG TPA: aspartyl protease family protein [Steroidobacteraceae bacterium]|nr:aspartyl protease family protein [Steroidobacteraceae bacterium]